MNILIGLSHCVCVCVYVCVKRLYTEQFITDWEKWKILEKLKKAKKKKKKSKKKKKNKQKRAPQQKKKPQKIKTQGIVLWGLWLFDFKGRTDNF